MRFFEKTPDGYILRVRLTPNASKNSITGTFTDASGAVFLKVGVTAAPEKGKANAALINFLSKTLKQPKTAFSLISGETDRYKKLRLTAPPEVQTNLNNLEEENGC